MNLVVVEVQHLELAHQAEGGRLDLGYLIVRQVQDLEGGEPDEGVGGEEVAGDGVAREVEEDEAVQALEHAGRQQAQAVVVKLGINVKYLQGDPTGFDTRRVRLLL